MQWARCICWRWNRHLQSAESWRWDCFSASKCRKCKKTWERTRASPEWWSKSKRIQRNIGKFQLIYVYFACSAYVLARTVDVCSADSFLLCRNSWRRPMASNSLAKIGHGSESLWESLRVWDFFSYQIGLANLWTLRIGLLSSRSFLSDKFGRLLLKSVMWWRAPWNASTRLFEIMLVETCAK